ncbi:ATP-binding cassette domain-containing protein [Nocardioides sp. NPDC000441]|uniref:ATP-binding cassette domain-containing protein n=1 Tax=Nocardioides sp. NPDC000441 TaxID=3154256 RepID=UPI00331E30ED
MAVDGQSLSGGQRQRLGLARALAAEASVLVLHDPTTAIDAVTEQYVAEELRRLRHGPGSDRSTLLFTSSPLLLAAADEVVWIRAGRVEARGTHDELATHTDYCAAVLR